MGATETLAPIAPADLTPELAEHALALLAAISSARTVRGTYGSLRLLSVHEAWGHGDLVMEVHRNERLGAGEAIRLVCVRLPSGRMLSFSAQEWREVREAFLAMAETPEAASVVAMVPTQPLAIMTDARANAVLIAAAPDLLAACEAVRDTCPADSDITPRWNAAWDLMLAAIAKARGGE